MLLSPGAPAERVGFRESILTSARVNATASPRSMSRDFAVTLSMLPAARAPGYRFFAFAGFFAAAFFAAGFAAFLAVGLGVFLAVGFAALAGALATALDAAFTGAFAGAFAGAFDTACEGA